jgi:hypothetical protein
VPLTSASGAPLPQAVSAGAQSGVPWGFVLDGATGAIFGFDLGAATLGAANDTLALANVVPNAIAAGDNAVLAISSDASSSANAVLWTSAGAQRLAIFSNAALALVCATAVRSGFAAVGATDGAAEVVLLDASGAVLSRAALPGNADMRPLACGAQSDALAVVTTGQFLTLSTANGHITAGTVAALPTPLAAGTHPRVAVAGGQTALANGASHTIAVFNNATGASEPLTLTEPGAVVALAATADASALLVGLGTGTDETALVAWFFTPKEEIPVARLGSQQGLADLAIATLP